MKIRKLGGSGLEVSPVCLGGNVFGWTADEPTSFAILDAFAGAGFNFIDTADIYSRWVPGHKGGESETVLGNWFKRSGKRKSVILATKVGLELAPDKKGLSKAYILREVEDSLQRLQTDYIDLYQSHIDDASAPLEETLEAYDQLIKQGKVRAIGASNYTGARLAEAFAVSKQHNLPRYECLQPHYNLYERAGYEKDLEPEVLKEGIGVIPYFALASGFLTGKYRSENDLAKGPRGQMVKKYLDERGFRILAALDEVSAQLGSTPGKVAIAWLIARPSITAPIASATSVEQLKELVDAANLHLDAAAIKTLNEASAY
ncbi:MAG TPA: aldo/keto reductase [Bryobacteraceae bacterium]|nr:aldo/keto reductase [Bryobacteraceae bacterium]